MNTYGAYSGGDGAFFVAMMGFLVTWGLVMLVIAIVSLVGMWRVYEKAGKPGWASIVPIYNLLVLVEIVGRPVWWFFLLFIPVINGIIYLILLWDLTRSFGQEMGFFLGLVFLSPIFFPILGFGSAQYLGPVASQPEFSPPSPPAPPAQY